MISETSQWQDDKDKAALEVKPGMRVHYKPESCFNQTLNKVPNVGNLC
jgi:hypothetical protein